MAPKAAAPAPAPAKGSISAFLGHMKVAQASVEKLGDAATALNKRKAEALAFYQSLPRQDGRKHEIINHFAQDKGMNWWESYSKVHKSSNSVETDRLKGYGSKAQSMHVCSCHLCFGSLFVLVFIGFINKPHIDCQFDVSAAMHIPLTDPTNPKKDHPMLLKILVALPSDDLWDESVPAEKALKDAGEPRYHLEKQDWDRLKAKEENEESNSTTGDHKITSQKALSSGSGDAIVKIEYPKYQEAMIDVNVLISSEARVQASVRALKQHQATLVALNNADSRARAAEIATPVSALMELQDRALAAAAGFKTLDKGNEALVLKEHEKVKGLIKETSDYLDISKQKIKKITCYLDGL